MKNRNNISKKLFQVILVLLFIPMLQAKFKFVDVKKLGGYSVYPEDISVTIKNWLDGVYQNNKEKYIKYNFGFCNWLIRAEHQWAFSAFGMSRVGGLIIGKENYLYEIAYINASKGLDFLGEEVLKELSKKVKQVQDTFNSMGKTFFFVTAPSKTDYYPEFLPKEYKTVDNIKQTNYKVFSAELKNNGVNHLDLNDWFLAMKDTTSFPLYTKTGIHYSTYGAALSAKRIINVAEKQLLKDLPELHWDEVYWESELKGSDDDLEKALNLVFKIPNRQYAYPQVGINEDGKYKPKAIVIGDSFYWQLVQLSMPERVFDNGKFWYYNKEVYPGKIDFGAIDMKGQLDEAEVVFIILTPPNMKKYLKEFVDNLYNFYFDSDNLNLVYKQKIQAKIQEIKADKNWLEVVKNKAIEQNISLDRMIYLDAKYMVDKES
ncbi:MAG: hypothetical protein MK207_08780 [Saprospiraceae bacterium]|nr:hypothetical protein [Saprospiraceae bacterium]